MSEPFPPAAPKQGMSTVAKVLIGCGILVVLGAMVALGTCWYAAKKISGFAKEMESNPEAATVKAAELALRLNPEIDVVSSDPANGTITIREKSTGKETTLTLDDIKNGRFTVKQGDEETRVDVGASPDGGATMQVTTDQGTATWGAGASAPPAWIPTYPGGRSDSLASIESNGEKSGSFAINTSDAADAVLGFYEQKLKEAGFEVHRANLTVDGSPSGTLTATSEKRTVSITAAAQDGATQALVTFGEKP